MKARLFPGLIAALPILALTAAILPWEPTVTLVGIVLGAGVTFLLANLVRELGKRVEERLITKWDGLPTTRMLRHRLPQNTVMFDRRRQALERLVGYALPTHSEELASPHQADDAYVAATRLLITQVRERRADFPRVHEENITYGFARNMLGVKPLAIVILLAAISIDGVAAWTFGVDALMLVIFAIHASLLTFWLLFVRSSWVLRTGTTYAERLFEVLDNPLFRSS
jgi:hypothetical protein